MDDDVGPANELALRIRRHLTDQGFDVIVLVEVAEGAQPFIDVTFPDGDGFGTWGRPWPGPRPGYGEMVNSIQRRPR